MKTFTFSLSVYKISITSLILDKLPSDCFTPTKFICKLSNFLENIHESANFCKQTFRITPMKNRGKSAKSEQDKAKFFSNSNFVSSSSDLPCKKHPSNSSSLGVCAYCLSEKLMKLVCSDCGEQRLSSCSCSNLSSYRNSSCTVDVGSVGRISVLIDNQKGSDRDDRRTLYSQLKLKQSETEDAVMFKRSNSCVVEVRKSYGFWRIGKFFKKNRVKEGCSDQKSDVSRSRSLSSFMGDRFHHEICNIACSSVKVSDFDESEGRKREIKGGFEDFEGGITVKDADFSRIDDDDEFIDLKIDLIDKSKTEQFVFRKCDQLDINGGGGGGEIKKMKNSNMQAWKWIFKHHSESDDHNHILKS